MGGSQTRFRWPGMVAAAAVLVALGAPADVLASGTTVSSGGGAFTQPVVPAPSAGPPPGAHAKGVWLSRFSISEYWPAPESWFVGALVSAPGLAGKYRVDWLYSAQGISMD